MGISKYEKRLGRLQILKECNFNLKDVRLHLIRECNLPKGYDLSKQMKEYKKLIEEKSMLSRGDVLFFEFMDKIKEECDDD